MSAMNFEDAQSVIEMLRQQVADLQQSVFQAGAARLAEFEADKPRLKAFLAALNAKRVELKKEVARLQNVVDKGKAGPGAQPGVGTGFHAIKSRTGPDGEVLSEESLQAEAARLRESLSTIDSRIDQARQELSRNTNAEEQDIWETNLVILQDTRRMHKEEVDLIEVELLGRERVAKASADKAAAEASGELALARAAEKLLQTEARIDRIKQQLFFPTVKGYKFALGSNGIYFGGKDIIVSEISGNYALTAEPGRVDKRGSKGARLTLQIGTAQPPPPARQKTNAGRPVSESLRLHMSGSKQPSTPSGSASSANPFTDSDNQEAEASQPPEQAEATETSVQAAARGGIPPRPPADAAGSSRGKRLAMKFVTKIANKDKYTEGFKKNLENVRSWAADKNGSDGADGSPRNPSGGMRASLAGKLSKAKSSAGKGLAFGSHVVGRAGRQLSHVTGRDSQEGGSFPGKEVSAYAGLGPTGTAQEDLAEAVADDAGGDFDGSDAASEQDLAVFDKASNNGLRSGPDSWEAGSSKSGGAGDASSAAGKQGMLVAVRCAEVALVGERGTKVPNFAVAELSLELEFQLSLSFVFNPVTGWKASGKPLFEISSLAREVKGNTVPLPKTLLRLILTLVLPRVLQRKILAALPVELGQYLTDAKQGVHVAGDIAVVGPALSALDADLAYQDIQATSKAKDAKRNAAHFAAAQEARSMLGLSPHQAAVLAELFGGRLALLNPPRPCTLGALQAYYGVFSAERRPWEQLGAVWATAARMVGKLYGADEPPNFLSVMDGSVAQLARKPVRARLQVTAMDISVNVDNALEAMRAYFVRSTRELHNKGAFMDLNAEDPESTLPEGYQSLEMQLEALEAFHSFWSSRLRTFKGKFREAGGTMVAGADARSFSAGVENVRYEGPLKLEIPIPLESLEPDGALTFELPLPDPSQQETISRFVGGLQAAMNTPVSMHSPALGGASSSQGPGLERTDSLWATSPSEWFSKFQDSSLGKTWGDALQDTQALGPLPTSLGKVLVNGMRVRIKLDERRLAELLKDVDAANVAGLLSHLGDVAALSFAPFMNEETGKTGYLLKLESSDAANLSAELVGLGYRSGDGISPGRLLRTAQALARAIMLTFSMDPDRIREVDAKMDEVYDVLIRDALDASACLEGSASQEDGSLFLNVSGAAGDNDSSDAPPGMFSNDIDLGPLVASLAAGDIEAANDDRIAWQMGFGKPR